MLCPNCGKEIPPSIAPLTDAEFREHLKRASGQGKPGTTKPPGTDPDTGTG